MNILRDPRRTKSTSYTHEERDKNHLRGLLPYAVMTMQEQVDRVLWNMRRKENDIEKYIFLSALQDRNETLFYRTVLDNIDEVMPLIYTPTVGQACREFAHIFRTPKGFYITPEDRGHIRRMLDNWYHDEARVIVVTDGQRILGLGDLGANGMGIPIGKLALYTACAGIHPRQCLPVMLDVGTNNPVIRDDPMYLGYPHERLQGEAYIELVDEFMEAITDKFPKALIQFEDFLTPNAYGLLTRYRDQYLCFNDDIQGTAAVALAGVYAAVRATGTALKDMNIMFLGAGSAATGIGELMAMAIAAEGMSHNEAMSRLWFVDKDGLLVKSRVDLEPHNEPFAQNVEAMSFLHAIDMVKPQVLIGATGAPGTFTEEVIRKMSEINHQPVIFALSNPTSRAECTAEQAYTWSEGRAIFSSGSPFKAFVYNEKMHRPGQGNNAYIFPGVGLAAVTADLKRLPEKLFLTAAKALADFVSDEDLKEGALYPNLKDIRLVSAAIAIAVAREAIDDGLSQLSQEDQDNIEMLVHSSMYIPDYDICSDI